MGVHRQQLFQHTIDRSQYKAVPSILKVFVTTAVCNIAEQTSPTAVISAPRKLHTRAGFVCFSKQIFFHLAPQPGCVARVHWSPTGPELRHHLIVSNCDLLIIVLFRYLGLNCLDRIFLFSAVIVNSISPV